MRFNRVLHPEILLGRRGPEYDREIYKKAMEIIRLDGGGAYVEAHDSLGRIIAQSLKKDHIFLRFMVNCKVFKEKKAHVYHIGHDFLLALQKIDRTLPIGILPESFSAYFSFADDTIFDEEGPVEGGYVTIGNGKSLGMKEDETVISISYICKQRTGGLPPFVSFTGVLGAKKIDEMVAEVEASDFFYCRAQPADNIKKRNDVFRTLLNAVVYLHSTEPLVEVSRPFNQSKISANEHRRMGLIINDCSLPVFFLHPKYQHKTYKVDSTWVDSFPRWQRCGVNLSQVKLVFVSSHERRFDTKG